MDQKPGFNKDLLDWMRETASANNIQGHGLRGKEETKLHITELYELYNKFSSSDN